MDACSLEALAGREVFYFSHRGWTPALNSWGQISDASPDFVWEVDPVYTKWLQPSKKQASRLMKKHGFNKKTYRFVKFNML